MAAARRDRARSHARVVGSLGTQQLYSGADLATDVAPPPRGFSNRLCGRVRRSAPCTVLHSLNGDCRIRCFYLQTLVAHIYRPCFWLRAMPLGPGGAGRTEGSMAATYRIVARAANTLKRD